MQSAFRLRTAPVVGGLEWGSRGPGDLEENKTTLVHTPSFRLSARLSLGPGSCQGQAVCLYYEAVLPGEPAGPWGEATAFLGCPGHVGEASFSHTSNTRASGVWPGEQPVGHPDSLGLVGPYSRREVRACCRGWDHGGLWPAFWRRGTGCKKGQWPEVASCVGPLMARSGACIPATPGSWASPKDCCVLFRSSSLSSSQPVF